MKKQSTLLLILLCAIFGAMLTAVSACQEIDLSNKKEIASIEVVDIPDTIIVGDLDAVSGELKVNYSDDTCESVPFTSDILSEKYREMLNKVGTYTIEILYRGKRAGFGITVRDLNIYTLTFKNAQNETVSVQTFVERDEQNVNYPSAEEMEVEGYRFVGFPEIQLPITEDISVSGEYVKTWEVIFYNGNGVELSKQIVDDGADAVAPTEEVYVMDGYDFVSWDHSFKNVHADTLVYGIYVKVSVDDDLNYTDEAYFAFTYIESTDSYSLEPADINDLPKEIIIPTTYNGKPVTAIGDYAFWSCSVITSVVIPTSITKLGMKAFGDCGSLYSVTFLSETVPEIGSDVFCYTWNPAAFRIFVPSVSVDLYKAVTANYWQSYAVDNIYADIPENHLDTPIEQEEPVYVEPKLSFSLQSDNTYYVSGMQGTMTTVNIPEEYNNLPVTGITEFAFDGTAIQELYIPSSVKYLGIYSFWGCNQLKHVIFEENSQLTNIDYDAFNGCSNLESFYVPEGVYNIGTYAFLGCNSLKTVTNDSMLYIKLGTASYGYIGYYATSVNNSNYQINSENTTETDGFVVYDNGTDKILLEYIGNESNIVIPEDITKIGDYAFYDNDNIRTVVFSSNLKEIGSNAFYYCDGLTEITIPANIEYLGNSAFFGCGSLRSVIFLSETVPFIGADLFGWCWDYSNFKIYVPQTALSDYKAVTAEYWQSYAKSHIVAIPEEE